MSNSLQELHRLLVESLRRDNQTIESLQVFTQRSNAEPTVQKHQVKVNQNLSLDELMGALKECMTDSIETINCIIEEKNDSENTIAMITDEEQT
ncbi:Protein CBG28075 [Caenorhabditis briggsae]|uniref:Uncharacterized protein n=2 Tax=Caenorhabditis briggsae TaxID=6238 RepID=A0AAE9A1C3_CAEBR|nr:Protein CBG28075 [Caenorhabditis briggsae]ULT84772.1 hypothetical protein L3Y34_013450 [Caenorhabditis briggsae]UMM44003.1 hypothetical protein L5515_019288 [Caenorhabditis briggsae]CAR99095.1 Protein CBG28075 [Caenorhabditis briggsae]